MKEAAESSRVRLVLRGKAPRDGGRASADKSRARARRQPAQRAALETLRDGRRDSRAERGGAGGAGRGGGAGTPLYGGASGRARSWRGGRGSRSWPPSSAQTRVRKLT